MACYLPEHLVRCSICKQLYVDARRLRCGCVYCYLCCLNLIDGLTFNCRCSTVHRFNSQDELEKALMIDTVVNDLVRQHVKQKKAVNKKLVDYDSTPPPDDDNLIVEPSKPIISASRSFIGKQIAVAQPPCNICKKKVNLIVFCDHCKCDICEKCIEQHRLSVAEVLHKKWTQCKNKFDQINEHVCM